MIELVAQSTTTVASRASLSQTRPAQQADYVDVVWFEVDNGLTVTVPGTETWELVANFLTTGNTRLAVYARRQLAGDAAATGTFTFGGTGFSQGGITTFSGAIGSGSVLSGTPVTNTGASSATATASSMTTAHNRAMVLAFAGNPDAASSHTSTFGNELQDASSGALYGAIQSTAGAIGSKTITQSPSNDWGTVAFALAPGTPVAQTGVYLSKPATASGSAPASAASAWGVGSYVDVLPAGWDFDVAIAALEFRNPAAPSLATTFEALLEVATGASGSETVIAQIPWTFRNVTAADYLQGDTVSVALSEPVKVLASTRVAVRVADSHTAALAYTGVKALFRELSAGTPVSATVSAIVDAAGGIAAVASSPWQGLQQLAATPSSPTDATAGLSAAVSSPTDATAGLSAAVSSPTDAAGGLSAAASSPTDAQLQMVAAPSSPTDATQLLASAVSSPVDAAAQLLTAASSVLDALQTITAAASSPWEGTSSLVAVNAIASTPFDAVAQLQMAAGSSVDAAAQLLASSSTPVDAAALLLAARSTPLDALQQLALAASSPWDAVGTAVTAVNATVTLLLDAVAQLLTAASSPTDATGGVLATVQHSLDSQLTLQLTGPLSWEAAASAALAASATYEAHAGLLRAVPTAIDATGALTAVAIMPWDAASESALLLAQLLLVRSWDHRAIVTWLREHRAVTSERHDHPAVSSELREHRAMRTELRDHPAVDPHESEH